MRRTPSLHTMPAWMRILAGGLIGLVSGLVLVALRPLPAIELVELRILDLQTSRFRLERPPDPRIVVAQVDDVDIDDVLLAFGERWPWHLELNAHIFQLMADAGVGAVLVDVYHFDRGSGPDDHRLTALLDDPVIRQNLAFEAETGAAFGAALKAVGNVAVGFELAEIPSYQINARVGPAMERLGSARCAGGPPGLTHPGADLPVLAVLEGAKLLGFANVLEDRDGIVRRAVVVGRWGELRVLSLPVAGLLLTTDATACFKDCRLRIGATQQRINPDGTFLVNFHAQPRKTFPRVAPSQILRWARRVYGQGEEMPPEARAALEGKILVWGINLAGQKDIVTTPVSGTFHGPEYQATILDNLIHGDGRVRASRLQNAALLLVVTVVLGLLAGGLRGRWALHLTPLLVILAGVSFAVWQFTRGTALDVFTPFLGVTFTWGGTSVMHLLTAGRRNRWLEGTFGRYLAPSIITALKEDPALLELGGRRRDLTILFSDVAGFTKLSEALEPEQVVELLNRYLTAHSSSVMEEGGVVDKFEGDAVMAFFGDPVPAPRHAEQACRTAISVIERLPSLRPVWEGMGLDGFAIRIGLNSGSAIVGNMGSSQRFDYTCMGDTVNLAARLEGANKAFDSVIMIGSQTYAEAGNAIVAKPLADLVVVGRGTPEPVYELLAMRASAPEAVVGHADAFARAHAAARRGDLGAAREALAEADRLRPGDGPVRWFQGLLERLEAGEEESPWSGILVLAGK